MSFRQYVRSYVQQLRQEGHQGGESHPETDVLLAYHGGSLSTEQANQVQEHLATCPECADLFLGLVNYLEWDLDPARLSVQDLTRSWQRFLHRKNGERECDAPAANEKGVRTT